MKAGISSASLFMKKENDEVFPIFNKYGVDTAEIFYTSFSEYKREFSERIVKDKGSVNVHSVHVLTTQFEPQLYSTHPKVKRDAFELLGETMESAKILGAKYYTFHGVARNKRSSKYDNYPLYGERTREIYEFCQNYGVTLSYENVEWSLYNRPGIFKILKEYCHGLKGVLDIKQARISGFDYREYLAEMASDISHVHISDINKDGKMCLPGKGCFDFDELIKRLKDVGFDGNILIEVYAGDFKEISDLASSYEFIKEKIYKYK